jgi:acid stress chaperone HdeB
MALGAAAGHDAAGGIGRLSRDQGETMKHVFALAVLIAGIAPAAAEKVDLSTMTCQQFISSDKETISLILAWLDGFYKEDDAPVIDMDGFVKNSEKLGTYCARNPQIGLITAADKVFVQ